MCYFKALLRQRIASRPGKQRRTAVYLLGALLMCKFGTSLLVPAVAHAAGAEAPRRKSFVQYRPESSLFPKRLHPIVETINELLESGNKEQTSWSNLLAKLESEKDSLSRGYRDEIFHLQGFVYEQLNKPVKAQQAYKASLQLSANNPAALFRLADLLKKDNSCQEALPLFKEVLWRSTTQHDEVLFALGQCHLELGDEEEGHLLIEQAIQTNPEYLPALRFVVSERQEQFAEEIDPTKKAALEAAIAADLAIIRRLAPEDQASAFSLARLLLKQSDPLLNAERLIEAETIAKQFAESSQYSDAEAVRLLFDVYVKQGNLEAARSTLERGLLLTPTADSLKNAKRQLDIQQQFREKRKQQEEEEEEQQNKRRS